MKWLAVALATLVLVVTMAVGFLVMDQTANTVEARQAVSGVTVPMTMLEVGTTNLHAVWLIDHAEEVKWTLSLDGVSQESLKQETHNCFSGTSARTLRD